MKKKKVILLSSLLTLNYSLAARKVDTAWS